MSPSRFDPASVALAKYLPATPDPCGRVSYGIPVQSNDHQYITRVDWNLSPKHMVYGRYMRDDYTLKAFFDPHDILVTSTTGNVEHAQTFVLGDTLTLSPTMLNSFHFTIGRRTNDRGTASDCLIKSRIIKLPSMEIVFNEATILSTEFRFPNGRSSRSYSTWRPSASSIVETVYTGSRCAMHR